MKTKFLILIFTILTSSVYAQDARNILDKAAAAYNEAGGIQAGFVLDSKHTSSSDTYSSHGSALLKGNKFRIEIPDAITWFDGSTQWVYLKDTEEVNISNPAESELQGISPAYLFNSYKSGYTLTYKGEKAIGGKTLMEVELIPKKQNSDLKSIVVGIDKNTNIFSTIVITDRSGMTNSLRITRLTTGANLSDGTFKFNKADYPDAEIIDLR